MFNNYKERRSEKGFSLMELIVVLVILGLLVTLVAPKFYNILTKSKPKVARIQIKDIEGALQLYSFDVGRFPSSVEGLGALLQNPGNNDSWSGPYVDKKELPKDPWGKPYQYRCPGLHGDFDLYSTGPDGTDGGDDDIVSWK
jgi:general secretion pathway protein G